MRSSNIAIHGETKLALANEAAGTPISAKNATTAKEKWFSLAVVTLPFTLQYASPIPVMSLGELLLVPFLLIFLYDEMSGADVRRPCFCNVYTYFFVSVFTSLVAVMLPWFGFSEFLSMLMRLAFYALVIYVGAPRFNVSYGMRCMSVLSVLLSVYLIVQWCAATFAHVYLPTYLSYDLLYSAEADEFRTNSELYYRYTFRPSSFFLEPSYFSFFVCVPLAYQLLVACKENTRRSLAFSAIITIALALSASSSGLVIGAIPWILFALQVIKRDSKGVVRFNPAMFFLVIAVVIALFVLLNSPLATLLLDRTQGGASLGPRVLRALEIISRMNFPESLVGVGINNLGTYVEYNNLYTAYDEAGGYTFVSLLFSSYVYSGIFGFLAFCAFLISLFLKTHTSFGRAVCLQFFALSIYSGMQFSARFAFFALVLLAIVNDSTQRKEIRNRNDRQELV